MRTVLRAFLCLALASAAWCEPVDDAARALAKKLAAHLAPSEAVQVNVRNLSAPASDEAARAKAVLERSLRRPASHAVYVLLTISQAQQDIVLVAEFDRNGEHFVEMVRYRPESAAPVRSIRLEKRLLCEQSTPILDAAVFDSSLLVLEPQALVLYERSASGWQRSSARPLELPATVRDPRGRLVISNGALTAHLPGYTCRGSLTPLDAHCDASGDAFETGGEVVRWTAGRNTLEAPGWPPVFSLARIESESGSFYLAAELDGRTHVYDSYRAATATLEGWGSDIVAMKAACESARLLLVSGAGDTGGADSLTVYRIAGHNPVRAGEPLEFSGPITALWTAAGGALAISRNPGTGTYAAYSITVDCGR